MSFKGTPLAGKQYMKIELLFTQFQYFWFFKAKLGDLIHCDYKYLKKDTYNTEPNKDLCMNSIIIRNNPKLDTIQISLYQ